jgi:aminomethyltransferase
MSTAELQKTPLYDWHKAHGGRLVEFGGWAMPVQYSTIVEEHEAVRKRAGLFDIGHMGRLRFDGPGALAWLQRVTTNDASRLRPGKIQYSLVCDADGGILDDVLVYRLDEGDAYGLVCNASNRLRVVEQFERHRDGAEATFADSTLDTAMIAVQGPAALPTLHEVFDGPKLADQGYYTNTSGQVLGTPASASRTGYTGEDGFELIVHRDVAEAAWLELLEAGQSRGIRACGLGARDTLRFEAAMPLYGHELSESVNPFAAGLSPFVKLEKGDFVGRDALVPLKDAPGAARVGLKLEGKRIARQGTAVLDGDTLIGTVTSGTFAPTLQQSLAMALVTPEAPPLGTTLSVEIRGRREPAEVVPLPFYRRPKV